MGQARMKVKAQKIIYRIKHAALVQCFEMWADNVREQVSLRGRYASVTCEDQYLDG